MKPINRFAALIATAAGAGLVAQATFAGPGCYLAGMKSSAVDNGYQPAIYQLTPGDRAAARAYPAGMGYGHSARNDAQADIVGTASAAGSFDTLVSAVKAAGLVDTLKGTGPFTVFAPTDNATVVKTDISTSNGVIHVIDTVMLPHSGQQYSYTFDVTGRYDYACDFHPSMKGSVMVEASGRDT